mmetsp:Transcript_25450/g.70969  ORF Transcript_25450/g.70969 Transcript_25450/m.70969 type:complete len:422 (+) Transcript_25450:583-1848(+)
MECRPGLRGELEERIPRHRLVHRRLRDLEQPLHLIPRAVLRPNDPWQAHEVCDGWILPARNDQLPSRDPSVLVGVDLVEDAPKIPILPARCLTLSGCGHGNRQGLRVMYWTIWHRDGHSHWHRHGHGHVHRERLLVVVHGRLRRRGRIGWRRCGHRRWRPHALRGRRRRWCRKRRVLRIGWGSHRQAQRNGSLLPRQAANAVVVGRGLHMNRSAELGPHRLQLLLAPVNLLLRDGASGMVRRLICQAISVVGAICAQLRPKQRKAVPITGSRSANFIGLRRRMHEFVPDGNSRGAEVVRLWFSLRDAVSTISSDVIATVSSQGGSVRGMRRWLCEAVCVVRSHGANNTRGARRRRWLSEVDPTERPRRGITAWLRRRPREAVLIVVSHRVRTIGLRLRLREPARVVKRRGTCLVKAQKRLR